MKKKDVKIGATYAVKVSGKITRVRITGESRFGGWDGKNLATGREVRVRTAAKLRHQIVPYVCYDRSCTGKCGKAHMTAPPVHPSGANPGGLFVHDGE